MDSDDIEGALLEKMTNGEITLKGETLSTKIKATVARIGLKIFSWFRKN